MSVSLGDLMLDRLLFPRLAPKSREPRETVVVWVRLLRWIVTRYAKVINLEDSSVSVLALAQPALQHVD